MNAGSGISKRRMTWILVRQLFVSVLIVALPIIIVYNSSVI
jgi:hypothetical protein